MSLFEINMTINAPELVGAINNLAEAFKGGISVTKKDNKLDKAAQKVKDAAEKKTAVIVDEKLVQQPEPQEEAAPEETTETVYTIEEVRSALGELSKTKSKEAAKNILTTLGVKSVSNLQPEQFAQAMKMIEEA